MALVRSLLTAIVRADGDALVMHVGERPYVVASAGPIELSAHGLNLEAMSGMLSQLLPPEALANLDEFGAVEHELASDAAVNGNRFVVVAARGGDDIWIEIRRHRPPPTDDTPSANGTEGTPLGAPGSNVGVPGPTSPVEATDTMSAEAIFAPLNGGVAEPSDDVVSDDSASAPREVTEVAETTSTATVDEPELVEHRTDTPRDVEPAHEAEPAAPTPTPEPIVPSVAPAPKAESPPPTPEPEPPPVVVPMARPVRVEPPMRGLSSRPGGIERLLRLASSRGASALYLPSDARPHLRIDGDIRVLEGEPVSSSMDVEAALLELMPETAREALRRGEPTEWVADLAEIGRVRGTTFRDYRGPGALFQMISARAASAEQLGLSREIQALATETDGLVVIAGPRASGKSTLIAAFVDAINRRRSDYVITLERQIRLVHENRTSLISQR